MHAHRQQLGSFLLCLPLCALAVGLFGVLRLRHQFPGAASSPGLLVPFLLPVAGLALEAGGLVALTYAQLRWAVGEGRRGGLARVRGAWPVLALLAGALLVAEAIPRGTEHPGAFANELLASAQGSCTAAGVVPVPLLGFNVRCAEPRRIEGPMPGVASVRVAMSELAFSDDLRRADIGQLELHANRALKVTLRAHTARVIGLAPWSRSPRFSAPERFAILLALGASLWAASLLLVRPTLVRPTSPSASVPSSRQTLALRWLARGLLALPGALTAAFFISLDQDRAPAFAYAGAAAAGVLVVALVAVVGVPRAPKIFNSFRDL